MKGIHISQMNLLPFGAPPILFHLKTQVQNYLENPQLLPIHDFDSVQQHWKHETDIKKLCYAEAASTPTTLLVERDTNTGLLSEVVEILSPHAGMTNKTSMSLQRIPGIFNSDFFLLEFWLFLFLLFF